MLGGIAEWKGNKKRGGKVLRFHGAISDLNFLKDSVHGARGDDSENEKEDKAVGASKLFLHDLPYSIRQTPNRKPSPQHRAAISEVLHTCLTHRKRLFVIALSSVCKQLPLVAVLMLILADFVLGMFTKTSGFVSGCRSCPIRWAG